jgi:hypothetical protein
MVPMAGQNRQEQFELRACEQPVGQTPGIGSVIEPEPVRLAEVGAINNTANAFQSFDMVPMAGQNRLERF